MLKLTNAHGDTAVKGKPLLIAPRHIVSIRPIAEGKTGILTVAGIEYIVAESLDEIGAMGAWDHLN